MTHPANRLDVWIFHGGIRARLTSVYPASPTFEPLRDLELQLRGYVHAGATYNLSTGAAGEVDSALWPHTLEAVKDEARLIQNSLLPSGTLRGEGFEIAFRFSPLGEVGGDFADFFSCRTTSPRYSPTSSSDVFRQRPPA